MSCLIQTGHIKDLLIMKGNDDAKAQFNNLVKNVEKLEQQLSHYQGGVEVEGDIFYNEASKRTVVVTACLPRDSDFRQGQCVKVNVRKGE